MARRQCEDEVGVWGREGEYEGALVARKGQEGRF